MAGSSSIEWTEMTWNPVTGCTKVSQGCKNCYAERMAKRLQAMGVQQYRSGFKPALAPQVLLDPYKWRRPRVVFVNSMSDLFHESVPLDYIKRVFRVMGETPHAYQVLTKRASRLAELSSELSWSENIWMGVSVENEAVTSRIDRLRECHAKHRFLSLEPLIGPLDDLRLGGVDWVIVGGESGRRLPGMQELLRRTNGKAAPGYGCPAVSERFQAGSGSAGTSRPLQVAQAPSRVREFDERPLP